MTSYRRPLLALLFSLILVASPIASATTATTPATAQPDSPVTPSVAQTTTPPDDPPDAPESYYGKVSINGNPAPVGTVITAVVNGEQRGQITVTEPGTYGGPKAGDEKLVVNASEQGATVRFYVGGIEANTTDSFDSATNTELNLSFNDTEDPTAEAGPNKQVLEGEQLTLDGTESSDDGYIVDYEWTLGDDTTKTGAVINHTYAENGTYEVTLTVTDAAGKTASDTTTVTVGAVENPPIASFTRSPETPAAGETVTFQNTSSDNGTIEEVAWDFDGDGTTDATGDTVTHTYSIPGEYNATLTVTDNSGFTDTTTKQVTVTQATRTLSATPDTAYVNATTVELALQDTDALAVETYRWDIDGDGTAEQTTETPSTTTVFQRAGDFTVTVEGLNGDTTVVNGSTTVTVESVDGTVSADTDTAIANWTDIGLTATTAQDVNQSAIEYEWTFGDGTSTTTNSNTVSHVYAQTGSLTATVTAQGPGGPVFTNTTTVDVERASGSLTADPTSALTNVTSVSFDATTDTADVTPITYEWDFDGDGTTEARTSAGESTHTFTENGTYESVVTALSEHGVLFTANASVTVTDPEGTLTASPASGFANVTEISLAFSGLSETARQSVDSYEWDFADGTTTTTDTNQTTHVYAEPGGYDVTVRAVTADGDVVAAASTPVSVTRASGQLNIGPPEIRANVTQMNASVTDITPAVRDDIASYEWTFGDGETATTDTNETSHVYTDPGSYQVTVRALTDSGDVIFDTETTIDVLNEGEPTASFTWSPTQPKVGETVTFDASNSTDNDPIPTYEWDFDGDGAVDATGEVVQHTFDETVGARTVSLTVIDQDGLTATSRQEVVVVKASGDLEASPTPGYANSTSVSLQLTNVTSDIDAESYEWDFDDGTTETTATNATSHTFAEPGTYEATVTAVNANGDALVVASTTIEIQRATADFTAGPDTVYANWTAVDFDVSNVTSGVDPASYEWDFDDGTTTTTVENGTLHTYAEPGTYTPTVRALAADGDVLFTENLTVTVTRASGDLSATPSTALTNITNVSFAVTNVTDAVSPDAYEWAFGDGESTVTADNSTTHVFNSAGNYTVTMRALAADESVLFTETVEVEVVDGDLTVEVTAPDEQRIQDDVTANVTITNERAVEMPDVNVSLTAQGDYWYKRDEQTTRTFGPVTLNGSESKTFTANITTWAYEDLDPYSYYSGRIQLRAEVDPNDTRFEANEANNRDVNKTVATYTDIETDIYTYYRGVIDEPQEMTVTIENDGSADAQQAHNVTVTLGDGTTKNFTISADNLESGDRVEKTFEHTYTAEGEYRPTSTVETDALYPENNQSEDYVRVRPFQLSMSYISTPYRVTNGSTFTVYGSYDTNLETEVNLTINLPDGLTLVSGESQNKTDQSDRWGGTVSWEVRATEPSDRYRLNVSVEGRDKSDVDYDTMEVVVPKIRVSDETAVSFSDDTTNNSTSELIIRNESTFEHDISLSVQAGFEGRTLEGLEYLFSYPYGCVEQTTSPMMAALHTDQYYRDRISPDDYNRQRVNESVAIGIESLSTGENAQHQNGAWSMWGNDPDGDRFYTIYALFGSTSIRNDEVYGTTPASSSSGSLPVQTQDTQDISTSLGAIDFNQTVHWIRDIQTDDGAIESDGYFLDDDPSMTGYALVAIEQAEPFNATTAPVAENLREDAARYLIDAQAANGSWNDDNAKSTAIAVWGLQSVADAGIENETLSQQVNASIEAGRQYLIDAQQSSGKWVEDRSSYWSSTGTTSQATAYALLALNETGLTADNQTVRLGGQYLVGVYDDEGSWGFTEATAIAIRALQEIGQGLGTTDRTVTVDIKYANGTTAVTKQVTVDSEDSVARVSFTADERKQLRQGAVTKTVSINATGSGTVVTALRNEQLVNREQYEATEQARTGTQQSVVALQSTATNTDAGTVGTHDDPYAVTVSPVDELAARDDQTIAVTVTNNDDANLLNPIVEVPIDGAFNASSTLDATSYSGTTVSSATRLGSPDAEVSNSTFQSGDAVLVFGRNVPAGESRTYTFDIDVSSPGDLDLEADVRPLYNESFNVRTSDTLSASGIGTVNVDVVDQSGTPASGDIAVDGSTVAQDTGSTTLDVTAGDHEITATFDGVTRSLNVSLADFETANLTFVEPDTVTDPTVVAQTADGTVVRGGSQDLITEQAANATAVEQVRRTFEVASTGGTTIVAFNDSDLRAFDADANPVVTVTGTNGATATKLSYTKGGDGDPSVIKFESTGDVRVNVTYTGRRLGDVNNDGQVTAGDAQAIAAALADDSALPAYADVNNDGQVTAVDAMLVAQYVNGTRTADYAQGGGA